MNEVERASNHVLMATFRNPRPRLKERKRIVLKSDCDYHVRCSPHC